jgi:hypothetical protein
LISAYRWPKISDRLLDIARAWWLLTLFVVADVRSNWHLASNPLFVKNGDVLVVSEAW